jgi:hypothetical protein
MSWAYTLPTWVQNACHPDWLLIELLVKSGAVIAGSGDGLSAYSASGSVFTASSQWLTGANRWGNVNAWVRIQFPDGREVINTSGGDTATTKRRTKISPAAGFVGGSPGAARAPSATDEVVVCGSGSDASPVCGIASRQTYGGKGRFVGAIQTTAPYGFWAATLGIGGASTEMITFHDPMAVYGTGDPDPMVYRWMPQTDGFTGKVWEWRDTCWARLGASYMGVNAQYYAARNNSGGAINNLTNDIPTLGPNPANGLYAAPRLRWARPGRLSTPNGRKGISSLFRMNLTEVALNTFYVLTSGRFVSVDAAHDHLVLGDMLAYWPGPSF